MPARLAEWLDNFSLHVGLRPHIEDVLAGLPVGILNDFLDDPAFALCDFEPGRLAIIPVGMPSRRQPARSVVLKRTLLAREPRFVRWVIAHELAHAHLRNGGRWPGEDPELAADALAAAWGFPRPPR